MDVRADSNAASGSRDTGRPTGDEPDAAGADSGADTRGASRAGDDARADETRTDEAQTGEAARTASASVSVSVSDDGSASEGDSGSGDEGASGDGDGDGAGVTEAAGSGSGAEEGEGTGDGTGGSPAGSRRPPAVTRDTARPEGGGRAASGDAPAPARQWPLLSVLSLTGIGLLIVGTNTFADAFRVGAILVGAALLLGAVLRRVTPSVGMLAVRSRFTDMITYGVLGSVIVLLALMAQPDPWLDVPFLEDAVHFTVR